MAEYKGYIMYPFLLHRIFTCRSERRYSLANFLLNPAAWAGKYCLANCVILAREIPRKDTAAVSFNKTLTYYIWYYINIMFIFVFYFKTKKNLL